MKIRTYKENVLLVNPPIQKEFLEQSFSLKPERNLSSVYRYDSKTKLQEEFECNYNEFHENGFFRYVITYYNDAITTPKNRQILISKTLIKIMTDLEPNHTDELVKEFNEKLEEMRPHLMEAPVEYSHGYCLSLSSTRYDYTFIFYALGHHVYLGRLQVNDPIYEGYDYIRIHHVLDMDLEKIVTTKEHQKRDSDYMDIDPDAETLEELGQSDLLESDIEIVGILKQSLQPEITNPFELCNDHFAVKPMIEAIGREAVIEIFSKLQKPDTKLNQFVWGSDDSKDPIKSISVKFWDNQVKEVVFCYILNIHKEDQPLSLDAKIDPRIIDKIKELNPTDYDKILANETRKRQCYIYNQSSFNLTSRGLIDKPHYQTETDYAILLDHVLIYSLTCFPNEEKEDIEAIRVFIDENDELQVTKFKKHNSLYSIKMAKQRDKEHDEKEKTRVDKIKKGLI